MTSLPLIHARVGKITMTGTSLSRAQSHVHVQYDEGKNLYHALDSQGNTECRCRFLIVLATHSPEGFVLLNRSLGYWGSW
jgi:hypothetical protein